MTELALYHPQMHDLTRGALGELQRLSADLTARQGSIKRRMDYFRGRHQLCFASPEFSEYFGERFQGWSDNWCKPVVEAPAERINPLGVRLAGQTSADTDLARVWRENGADRGASEAVTVTLAAGRAYSMVWGDPEDDDEDTPLITWERPDQAIVGYDAETRRPRSGLKLWRDENYEYASLYTRRYLWKWKRSAARVVPYGDHPDPAVQAGGGWEMRQGPNDHTWPIPNPMGRVPLVEWRNQSLLDDTPLSDIDGVMAMQDGINLIWAYLLNALDFASLPTRVVTGADTPKIPILDANGRVVGDRPVDLNELRRERILWIPKEANVEEWTAANLEVFSNVIERAIEHISAQTRTPPHYLVGKVSNLSAEAFTAAETGLVSKAGERIIYLDPAARGTYELIALAQGNSAKARAVRGGKVMWGDPQYRSMAQKVDALMKLKGMGFPLEWIAEQYGLEPDEVARVMLMRQQEAALDPLSAIADELGRGPAPGALPASGSADPMV